jgi:hypothetical protein
VGPAFRDAEDGVVEGWRLAVTGVTATIPPRVQPGAAFDDVCGGRPDSPDTVRVAIVIDFGTAAGAPTGEQPPAAIRTCVEVSNGANGFDALRDVVDIRSERGLICGLAGYPRTGCAERVESAAADDDAGGTRPEPADPDDSPDRAPERDGAGAGSGGGAGTSPEDTAPRTPDPVSGDAPATANTDTAAADSTDADSAGFGAELARAQGDGDAPTPSDEPTYPATETGSTAGPAPDPAAPTAGAAAAGTGGESPLRSPWLIVPVLVLIAALGGTAWRRSRAGRSSGGVG